MIYYHFTSNTLRDGRPIPQKGTWLKHDGPIIPCKSGLHASSHPFDALHYAPGPLLHRVELGGDIVQHEGDKVVAERRKILATIDATLILRRFACLCALDVLPLWPDAPAVVRKFLLTGDGSLREAAKVAVWDSLDSDAEDSADRDTARGAVESATRDAAHYAAWVAAQYAGCGAADSAAWGAAQEAAQSASRAAAEPAAAPFMASSNIVWAKAWGKAKAAATAKQRRRFAALVNREFSK